jgi:pSer/pThr/pTyr-binding forkhead associated (FHA) protein
MSAVLLMLLRVALAVTLYAFLGWVLFTIWRDLKNQVGQLAVSQVMPVRLSFETEEGLQELHLSIPEITLGRDPGNDCLLNDKTVSNRHARLSFHHQQWWLEDLGSTNGTFLNQEAITSPMIVTSGDQITCGKINVAIQVESPTNPLQIPRS